MEVFSSHIYIRNGFELIKDKKEARSKTFQCIISDLGAFYEIIVYFKVNGKNVKKITFIDSMKIINMKVSDIAKTFNLPISKLSIDYNKPREIGYILTDEEIEYVQNDVKIVAMALNELFKEKLTKMTAASNAMHYYKEITGRQKFEHYFPVLTPEEDSLIRPSYKGGFTYLNPIYKDLDLRDVYIFDVNSLYPSRMRYEELCFGKPVYFEGQYKEDKIYPLYIQKIMCSFKIKKNKIPTIQIKQKNFFFMPNEYIEDSKGEEFVLTLTNIDLEMFFKHYDVENLVYIDGFKFRAIRGLFDKYIDYWTEKKIQAGKEGNKGKRTIAKMQLNSLYGKFAKSTTIKSKYPFVDSDGIIHFTMSEAQQKNGIYLPVAAFITAYARKVTIETSQKIRDYSLEKYNVDMYIYSDTDSIHTLLPVDEIKKFCDVDDYRLGAWAWEGFATRAKFVRQKCYVEELEGKMKITCAGLPENCYSQVTWENFKEGFTAHGKLTYKYVKGGVKLVETDFTIKEDKIIG